MRLRALLPLAALALAGCVTFPSGPSIMALPGSRMSFDQFRADDFACRDYARQSIGGADAQQAAVHSGVTSAAVGTAIGAIAGAAIGGSSRDAGVGAGAGLLFGSIAGSGAADASGRTLQQRYDVGYTQCMYAKGHRVPVAGRFESAPRAPAYTPPPPPPGSPPPPPPGASAPPPPPPAR
ncbi:MAG: hypothetical protein IT531_19230 [Burkholderiales bacterium]|nr:hypothetical protein [Burkholderiales bacterium]